MVIDDEIDTFYCSSWCRFLFYKTDFGFGEPVWVSVVTGGRNKNAVLARHEMQEMGMKLKLCWGLEDEEMELFESNQELLAFTSLNSSAIWSNLL